jgi:hypothetical protein
MRKALEGSRTRKKTRKQTNQGHPTPQVVAPDTPFMRTDASTGWGAHARRVRTVPPSRRPTRAMRRRHAMCVAGAVRRSARGPRRIPPFRRGRALRSSRNESAENRLPPLSLSLSPSPRRRRARRDADCGGFRSRICFLPAPDALPHASAASVAPRPVRTPSAACAGSAAAETPLGARAEF